MATDTTCRKILARFPGPVTLYPSRRKWLMLLVASLLFAIGIAATGDRHWTAWLGALLSAVMIFSAVVLLLAAIAILRTCTKS